jgi:hypothetical protein
MTVQAVGLEWHALDLRCPRRTGRCLLRRSQWGASDEAGGDVALKYSMTSAEAARLLAAAAILDNIPIIG